MKPTIAIILAVLAAPAAAQERGGQFDLVCTGQQFNSLVGGRGRPWSERIRVDLSAMRWCEGPCEEATEIAEVTADEITFSLEKPERGGLRISSARRVSRITGEYEDYFSMIGVVIDQRRREGQCERAPFSGMPQARF